MQHLASDRLVDMIYAQTEGNPLFVTRSSGCWCKRASSPRSESRGRESWSVRIPEGVREVIGRRLERLSETLKRDARDRVRHRPRVRARLLKRLIADLSEDRLLEVLEEALAARVIEELARAWGATSSRTR